MATISASAARQTLPAELDKVEAGEQVEITRHGRVVAVLVSPDLLGARRGADAWAQADHLGARLDQARAEPLRASILSAERAEELVRGVDADRSAR